MHVCWREYMTVQACHVSAHVFVHVCVIVSTLMLLTPLAEVTS